MASVDKPSTSEQFVNEGLQRWENLRADWVAAKKGVRSSKIQGEIKVKAIVDYEDIIDRLFSSNGSGVLPEPLALGQMIEILTEFWDNDE